MKRKPKKLVLSRETLGNMDAATLKHVAGATAANSCTACTGTLCSDCCTRTLCTDCTCDGFC
jgi:hypothetical protein